MDRKHSSLFLMLFFLTWSATACNSRQIPQSPLVTPPAISLEITGDICPAIEVDAGMQIAWTNRDNIDHVIRFERKDANGVVVESGGTDLLQPGSSFSISFMEPGQYTYYCSKDGTAFGTITVLP